MMKLEFDENKALKQAFCLYNTFGPPDFLSRAMRDRPMLFGEIFYTVSKIDLEISRLPEGYQTLFKHIFGEKITKVESERCKKILKALKSVPIFEDVSWPELSASFKREAKQFFSSNALSNELKRTFGFDLPKSITIAIAQNFQPNSSSGTNLYYSKENNACYIAIEFGSAKIRRY